MSTDKKEKTATVDTTPATTLAPPLSYHRFVVSNVKDVYRPIVCSLVIQAATREAAKSELTRLESSVFTDSIPGVSRGALLYEEAAAYLRDGYGIRHAHWPQEEVLYLHPKVHQQADVYCRTHDVPMMRPIWLRCWVPDAVELLQSDVWVVVGKLPPSKHHKG